MACAGRKTGYGACHLTDGQAIHLLWLRRPPDPPDECRLCNAAGAGRVGDYCRHNTTHLVGSDEGAAA